MQYNVRVPKGFHKKLFIDSEILWTIITAYIYRMFCMANKTNKAFQSNRIKDSKESFCIQESMFFLRLSKSDT